MTYTTNSAEETQQIAGNLADKYRDGGIIALIGPLGAGKTTFTQGFAQGLGIKDKIISPTFVLMRQYDIPGNPKGKLFHIDLYRLDNITQIEDLGISEILSNPKNIVLIEWAEKLGNLLPQQAIKIELKQLSENSRQIEVKE
jgi:tRNA threonylcarbamoyladenosine biosynthesis protein TsaE